MLSQRFRFYVPLLAAGFLFFGIAPLQSGMVWAETPGEILYRDLWQTVQARKLLMDDPQLGSLNLGVKVTNRTAVLWGPVPSQELSSRAEQRLRTMFELIEIRNQMTLEPTDDFSPLPQAVPEKPGYLPDPQVPSVPKIPIRPLQVPSPGVALAGIVIPEETLTARSSPRSQNDPWQTGTGQSFMHMPFLGSIPLPR